MTGIIPGLLWKIIFRYTVIDYNDGFKDQSVVIDFHLDAENVQRSLYHNMIEAKLISAKELEQQQETAAAPTNLN